MNEYLKNLLLSDNFSNNKEAVFQEISDTFFQNCDDNSDYKISQFNKAFSNILAILKELNLYSEENIKYMINSLKKSLIKDEDSKLIKLIEEKYIVNNQMQKLQEKIDYLVKNSFKTIKQNIHDEQTIKIIDKFEYIADTQDIFIDVCEAAFVTILENSIDVFETSSEVSKNLIFYTLNGYKFDDKKLILNASILIKTAAEIANESKIYSYDLIYGAIQGANEGIIKSSNKFKTQLKFLPTELAQDSQNIQIRYLQNQFIVMLKEIATSMQEPAKSHIEEIIKKDYDNYIAKMLKISSDTKEILKEKIEEIGIQDNYKELIILANLKIEEIKNEISKQSERLKDSLDVDEKISKIKDDLAELEKSIVSKIDEIKQKAATKPKADLIKDYAKKIIESALEKLNLKKRK